MIPFDHELRLLHFVLLNAVALFTAWKFVRRAGGDDPIMAMLDSALLWILIQYISVGLTGLSGVLSSAAITIVAMLICGGLWLTYRRQTPALRCDGSLVVCIACLAFVCAYLSAMIFHQRYAPVLSIDAMSYHLPAAAQWLQTGRLETYEAWFYNPANVYSPLAGSMIDVWWIAPIGDDVLVRFVQAPALIMVGLGIARICRSLGANATTACLIATFALMSRPLVSQADIPKDDLYVAAFFVCAVAGLSRQRLVDPLSGWRIGVSVGLLLATKYTALLSVPMLLLAIDSPLRARWCARQWVELLGCVLVLAGPWYLRNALLTGNPFYPMDNALFDGMLRMSRSDSLANPLSGLWHVLTQTYHSFSWPMLVVILAAWTAGAMLSLRRMARDPLARLVVAGPLVGLALFAILSPYPEIRFLYPVLAMMFCMIAPLAHRVPTLIAGGALACLALVAGATAFAGTLGVQFAIVGLIVAGIGAGLTLLHGVSPRYRAGVPLGGAALVGALLCFVYWTAYVRTYREWVYLHWSPPYGRIVDAWRKVRESLPSDAVLAYANTYLTYPLYGFDLDRRVTYAPTRHGVRRLIDLPDLPEPATDQNLRRLVEQITISDPDPDQWLARLKSRQVTHLLIVKPNPDDSYVTAEPPELEFARQRPDAFHAVYDDPAAVIFSVSFAPETN